MLCTRDPTAAAQLGTCKLLVRKGADRSAAVGGAGKTAAELCRSADPNLRELLKPPDGEGEGEGGGGGG